MSKIKTHENENFQESYYQLMQETIIKGEFTMIQILGGYNKNDVIERSLKWHKNNKGKKCFIQETKTILFYNDFIFNDIENEAKENKK